MRYPRNRKNESPERSPKGHDTQPAEQKAETQADRRAKHGKGRRKPTKKRQPPRRSTASSSTTSTTSTFQVSGNAP